MLRPAATRTAGDYRLVDDELRVTALFSTEIGCDADRHAQDAFLVAALLASPRVSLEGDTLTLHGPSTTIELVDRTGADPDRPLIGTTWVVTGFIDGEIASSFATDSPASILFVEGSTLSGFDGVPRPSRSPSRSPTGSVGGELRGDGELQFGPLVQAESAGCPTPAGYEDAFYRMFETSSAVFAIEGPKLTILNADGAGVTFVAESEIP